MNSIHLSSLRRKVSGRGLKWSSFFILSAVLITSGFFIYNALAEDIFAVTSPSGGEYWRATQTVTWTSPSVNPAYNFYVYAWKDNNIITSYSVDISGLSYTARSTSWNTVGVPDGSYNIRVLLYDPNTSTEVGQVFSSAFTVDNTAPTMNSAQTKTVTSIDVTFSEDLNGATVATGDFSVAGNTVSTATESAPGIITLILGTPIATDAVPAVTLVNGQSVADLAGNTVTGDGTGTYNKTPTDGIAPTIVSVNSDKADGSYKAGEVIDIDVTFSENVTSAEVAVTLETGNTDRSCTFAPTNANTGTCNYTVQVLDTSADLNVNTIAGTINDQSANTMSDFSIATNLAANKALVIDTTPPTVTVIMDDDALNVGDTSLVTFTFSEAPTNFTTTDVTFGNGAIGTIDTSNALVQTAIFTPTDDIEVATNIISVGTAWTDAAGNAPLAGDDSPNYTIDTKEPTVIGITPTALAEANVGSVTVDITFSENMNQADNTTVNVAGITGSPIVVAYGSWTSATIWRGTFILVDNNEEVTNAYYTVSGAEDVAGNTMVAIVARGVNNPLDVDTIKPTVEVTMGAATFKVGETTTVTFTFSEAPTNFTVEDATVINNGALTGFAVDDGDAKIYTATFTPTDNIEVTTNVITVGMSWTDAAGNAPLAGDDSPNYTIDTKEPTVIVTMDDAALNVGDDSLVTFTFSEAPTGFATNDVTVGNGTIGAINTTNPLIQTATYTPTDDLEAGTNVITVGTTWTDAAGNVPQAVSDSPNYTIDTKEPIVIIASVTADPTNGLIAVTVQFSETVTGFDGTDITIGNGVVESFVAVDGDSYTFNVNPT
ncbi:MAG: Ig-like domain-containing protein, partial [Patescibacteria group bacterium]